MEQIELLTVEQLCRILQIGKNTAYKLIHTGEIKGFRVGRSWKIPRDSIDEYLNFKVKDCHLMNLKKTSKRLLRLQIVCFVCKNVCIFFASERHFGANADEADGSCCPQNFLFSFMSSQLRMAK